MTATVGAKQPAYNLPICVHERGGSHTQATIRRTSGSTSSSVGKAMTHDKNQATGQVPRKAALAPRLLSVDMAETISDISTDSTNGMTKPA